MMPMAASVSMSLMLPESTNSFIGAPEMASLFIHDPRNSRSFARAFHDANRRRTRVAGLVHGFHHVDVRPAGRHRVLEPRLRDRRRRERPGPPPPCAPAGPEVAGAILPSVRLRA